MEVSLFPFSYFCDLFPFSFFILIARKERVFVIFLSESVFTQTRISLAPVTVLLRQRCLRAMCWGRRHELLWSHLFSEAMPIPPRPPGDRWQLRHSLPTAAPVTEALPKRGWGVLAHNSPTLPAVRVIKLGIVQACRRLPILIPRDKILSWCSLVKIPLLGYVLIDLNPANPESPAPGVSHQGEREATGITLQLIPLGWWKSHTIHLQLQGTDSARA